MPRTRLVIYQEVDGTAPLLKWLERLARRAPTAYAKCVAKLQLLGEMGHELRRPAADFLRDGIYELRIKVITVNYRILYFYHGRNTVVLSHGLTKEKKVPAGEIAKALQAKKRFEGSPDAHTHSLWSH